MLGMTKSIKHIRHMREFCRFMCEFKKMNHKPFIEALPRAPILLELADLKYLLTFELKLSFVVIFFIYFILLIH